MGSRKKSTKAIKLCRRRKEIEAVEKTANEKTKVYPPCGNAVWKMKTNAHLLSRATLLPRTQLSCSWTHSAVLCKSAARPAVGGGLGLL